MSKVVNFPDLEEAKKVAECAVSIFLESSTNECVEEVRAIMLRTLQAILKENGLKRLTLDNGLKIFLNPVGEKIVKYALKFDTFVYTLDGRCPHCATSHNKAKTIFIIPIDDFEEQVLGCPTCAGIYKLIGRGE